MRKLPTLALTALALATPMWASAADATPPAGAKNIVIVHGSFVDGSGWRVVHDILIHKGYKVTVVHQPATNMDEDIAADQTRNRSDFLSASQVPATTTTFGARTWAAAWHHKPSYGIVATDDKALNPDLQRWMYKRAGSVVTEIKGSHMLYISQPEAVAKVIEQAALNVK